MTKNKKRLFFALAALLLLITELCIALFMHDDFVRPFGGDVLVVILLYCLVRMIRPNGWPMLSVWIFLFAVGVEALQYIRILDLLHLSNSAVLSALVGTSFSHLDIVCYAVGSALNGTFEIVRLQKRKPKLNN